MNFYRLDIGSFNQYKYAWAEVNNNFRISNDYPKCPKCGRATGQRIWLPPHNIDIKQPKNIPDFLNGIIYTSLVVSQRFKTKYESAKLNGISEFFALNVIKVGIKGNRTYDGPNLYGAIVGITMAQVDYKKMGVKWSSKPKRKHCDTCCPGGGGDGGIYQSYKSISIKPNTLFENDFFVPINFAGNIIVSETAKQFIDENGFTNVRTTHIEEAGYDSYRIPDFF